MSDWVRKLAQQAKQQRADHDRQAGVISARAPALWEQVVGVIRACLEDYNAAFQGDQEREVRWIQPSNHLLYVVRKYRPDPSPGSISFDVGQGRIEARVDRDNQLTRHFILPEPEVLEAVDIAADESQNLFLEHAGRRVSLDEASEILLRPLLFGEAGRASAARG
jgi:hypothetical protein